MQDICFQVKNCPPLFFGHYWPTISHLLIFIWILQEMENCHSWGIWITQLWAGCRIFSFSPMHFLFHLPLTKKMGTQEKKTGWNLISRSRDQNEISAWKLVCAPRPWRRFQRVQDHSNRSFWSWSHIGRLHYALCKKPMGVPIWVISVFMCFIYFLLPFFISRRCGPGTDFQELPSPH